MSKPRKKILIQLDTDPQPSLFDSVVAVDAGVDHLFRYGGVTPAAVRDLVHGAMFTRGADDLKQTAIFIGGSDVAAGEALLKAVADCFFGTVRCSVMMDSNGANTTAAAAVIAATQHLELSSTTALVLAATGPVGSRAVRLLAREGASLRVGSRSAEKAETICQAVRHTVPSATLTPCPAAAPDQVASALADVQLVIAAGAAGVQLLSAQTRRKANALEVAIDLNAVAPLGIEGIDMTDRAIGHDGIIGYGAIGIGGTKMKIHRRAIRRLFESSDQILDAEEIFALGCDL